ncbi:MAG TPA: diaminopimelate epimerase [Acidimicrobiales bacterium]|nr:diaminopimelate epimerase [Acidimicrobiales bacterium]
MHVRLSKLHGAGNDFLVLVDLDGRTPLTDAVARALCDRRLGVGADGLLRAWRGGLGSDLTMDLRNADGTVAEMSGNGIRCLVHAAIRSRAIDGPVVTVDTLDGQKRVEVKEVDRHTITARVEMGQARVRQAIVSGIGLKASLVDMGNPHLVVLDDAVDPVDLDRLGPEHPDLNVEVIRIRPDGDLDLVVWERGVGRTLACGTGTCAAAAAAQGWGIAGSDVVVHNPGGLLRVELAEGQAVLEGPSTFVADVEVSWPS